MFAPPFSSDEELFASPVAPLPASSQSHQVSNQPGAQASPAAAPASSTVVSKATVLGILTLPEIVAASKTHLIPTVGATGPGLRDFLRGELDVSRLNIIHKHLQYAGLEYPCRPLHEQLALGRQIRVTERADLHMLWIASHIYMKPLPDFLLNHDMWKDHLCEDKALYEDARGFLLSYIWLVRYKSDLRIAIQEGLLPWGLTWEQWISFCHVILPTYDFKTLANVNVRYHRGELRLHRINWITRLCSKSSPKDKIRGYHSGPSTYGSFVARHLTVLTAALIYIALVLTAMQVGLATEQLIGNTAFNSASYGFAVFAIIAPLVGVGLVFLVTLYLIYYNWQHAMKQRTYAKHASSKRWEH